MEKQSNRLFGAKQKWCPVIHVKDLMGIYMHSLLNSNVSGVLNAVTPQPVKQQELSNIFFPWSVSEILTERWVPFPHILEYLKDKNGCKISPTNTLKQGYEFIHRKPSSLVYICTDEDNTEV